MANGDNPPLNLRAFGAMAMPPTGQPGQPIQIDPSLTIPVTGQPSGTTQTQQPNITLAQLQQYLLAQRTGQVPQPSQPTQQPTQPTDRGQQVQRSGREPASIRYNNPGAMWPGPSSKKFGSSDYGVLKDGNLIAHFDDPVKGAAAQLDLLSSKKYVNRPIGELIGDWSGHTGGPENVARYADSVAKSIGLSSDQPLTPEILRSPAGIAFAKAQAKMEAGSDYPLSDDQWTQAQKMAFPDIAQR